MAGTLEKEAVASPSRQQRRLASIRFYIELDKASLYGQIKKPGTAFPRSGFTRTLSLAGCKYSIAEILVQCAIKTNHSTAKGCCLKYCPAVSCLHPLLEGTKTPLSEPVPRQLSGVLSSIHVCCQPHVESLCKQVWVIQCDPFDLINVHPKKQFDLC